MSSKLLMVQDAWCAVLRSSFVFKTNSK